MTGGVFKLETNKQGKFTVAGTNIEEVKMRNEHSGLTFKELNKIFEQNAMKDINISNESKPENNNHING